MAYDHSIPLLEHLANSRAALRRSEQKVADLVADNPRLVVDSTMAAVAAAAQVSEPTVMRFATSLGFDGFQQFRLALAQALALGLPATLSTIDAQDDTRTISGKVFDHTISSLDRARRYLDVQQVQQTIEAILTCSSIVFVGQGASAVIAMDAAQKAALFGVPCISPEDPHQQYMAVAMGAPDTLVFAVSNAGETRSVIDVVRTAKSRGLVVIGMTGSADTSLGKAVDVPLIVKTFENTDIYTPTVSRLAGLVMVDVLATAVAIRRGQAHTDGLSRMKEGLSAFRRD